MKTFLLILLISLPTFAADKAQVVILKGKATMLAPGAMKAKPVKRGDWLLEDTSIVTHEKSFVKVKFRDRSTMNVGPKSKVVISKMPNKKANMVNLLTGMINAEVKKNSDKKTKTKMLIKTRTAVMGVRGTKFQSIYNAQNKRTSLVTIEGKVAMVDKKEEPVKTIEEKKAEAKKTTEAKKAEVAKKEIPKPKAKVDEVDELDKLFEKSDNVVEVPEGRFSGVGAEAAKPTVPVKIAPEQYDAIAKSIGSKKKAKDVMKATDKDPKPEGFKDLAKGKVAPKAGGFVDFQTGLYIPPTEDAKLDEKTGTYEAKDVGKVDTKTGDYIPPKGIKVDAVKGFVIDKKEVAKLASSEDKVKLKKTLNKLTKVNKEIKEQVVVNKMENKASSSSGWGPKDHGLSVKLIPYSEVLTVENQISGSEADFYTSEADWIMATWNMNWNDKWYSRARIGDQSYKVDDSDTPVFEPENDNNRGYISLGVGYQLNPKMKLYTDLVERGESYVLPAFDEASSEVGVELRRVTMQNIELSLEYAHGIIREFDVNSTATLQIGNTDTPGVDEETIRSESMYGIILESSAYYAFKTNLGLNTSLRYHRHVAENSDFIFTRNSLGLGLELVWDI